MHEKWALERMGYRAEQRVDEGATQILGTPKLLSLRLGKLPRGLPAVRLESAPG